MQLSTPLTLPCGLVLRNRVARAAAFAGGDLASVAATLGECAAGGAGLVTLAYTSVSADGRTFAEQVLLTPEGAPADLAAVARAVHAHGAALSVQLTHAGGFAERKLLPPQQARPLAPSAVFDLAALGWPREAGRQAHLAGSMTSRPASSDSVRDPPTPVMDIGGRDPRAFSRWAASAPTMQTSAPVSRMNSKDFRQRCAMDSSRRSSPRGEATRVRRTAPLESRRSGKARATPGTRMEDPRSASSRMIFQPAARRGDTAMMLGLSGST
jgi:hypothetical protein